MLTHPLIAGLAVSDNATAAQVIFSFVRAIGMLPLTGTSNAEHMKLDLSSRELTLPGEEIGAILSHTG